MEWEWSKVRNEVRKGKERKGWIVFYLLTCFYWGMTYCSVVEYSILCVALRCVTLLCFALLCSLTNLFQCINIHTSIQTNWIEFSPRQRSAFTQGLFQTIHYPFIHQEELICVGVELNWIWVRVESSWAELSLSLNWVRVELSWVWALIYYSIVL